MSYYGNRYQPKVLLEDIVQLDYGIDIPEWKGSTWSFHLSKCEDGALLYYGSALMKDGLTRRDV
jgi:hypothetical protein